MFPLYTHLPRFTRLPYRAPDQSSPVHWVSPRGDRLGFGRRRRLIASRRVCRCGASRHKPLHPCVWMQRSFVSMREVSHRGMGPDMKSVRGNGRGFVRTWEASRRWIVPFMKKGLKSEEFCQTGNRRMRRAEQGHATHQTGVKLQLQYQRWERPPGQRQIWHLCHTRPASIPHGCIDSSSKPECPSLPEHIYIPCRT
jgi:hypothetical protein